MSHRLLTRRELLQTSARMTLGDTLATLGNRPGVGMAARVPGPVTTVQLHRGLPTFFLDGKPFSAPVFETYVPEAAYFRQFAAAGCRVYSFSTNLGAGFRAPCWLGPDRWDFSDLDLLARRVLDADPKGLIMPRVLLSTPDWWMARHPEEAQILDTGRTAYSEHVSMGRAGRVYPSVASHRWREETAGALRHLVSHILNSDYGAHLFGVMVTGLMTEEWYHWSIHTGELADYSKPMTAAFRDWLRARYGTEAALRAAWRDPAAAFESAAVPPRGERMRERERTFRDPAGEMPVIDYYLFYNEIIPETIDHFARAVKEKTGRRKVVGAFYGYMFEFSGDPEFGHNALGRLLRSPNIDFMMVTASYFHRGLGAGADYFRPPARSVALSGKLWYHDNDTVSFLHPRIAARRGMSEEQARSEGKLLGATRTAAESVALYRRGAGLVLGGGAFQSFFDLHGGYFDDPELMAEVGRLYALFEAAKRHDRTSASEILVVSDEASCAYLTFQSDLLQRTLIDTQPELVKLGAPHDSVLVEDLDRLETAPYRLVIFLNTYHLSDAQRVLIQRKLLGAGRTVLWCYAAGLFNGHRTDAAGMHRLTGIRMTVGDAATRVSPRIDLTDGDSPLARELRAEGLSVLGPMDPRCRPITAMDAEAIAVGTLAGTEAIGLAVKGMPGWRSVTAITSLFPAAFYRALARVAGVHIYNDQDDALYASRGYLALTASSAGPRRIRLPVPCDVIDPFTRRRLHRARTEFTRDLRQGETLLVRLVRKN